MIVILCIGKAVADRFSLISADVQKFIAACKDAEGSGKSEEQILGIYIVYVLYFVVYVYTCVQDLLLTCIHDLDMHMRTIDVYQKMRRRSTVKLH